MVFCHYLKEVFEALAVNYFKQTTMGHNILAFRITVEWLFVGFGNAYYVFNPQYTKSTWISSDQPFVFNMIIGAFVFAEFMSLLSNIHLSAVQEYRDLHPEGNQLLAIPQHHGFRKVSCANYFWQLCCWVVIAFCSKTLVGYIYLCWKFFELNQKAQKIHYQYVAKYRDEYPQDRRALIPYLF